MRKIISHLMILSCIFFSANSFSVSISVDKLKAAYIFKFIPFITWEHGNTITLIGAQEDELLNSLNELVSKKENIRIFKYTKHQNYSIVYLNCEHKLSQKELLEYQESSTLLISSCEGDIDNGVMINFVVVDEKLKFKINNTSAKNSKIKISSQLLKLALVVK